MIENVQFKGKSWRKNSFQKQMSNDIKGMSKEHVYVKSDKTNNYFKLEPEKHETLLERNIQKEYKKSDEIMEKLILRKEKKIAEDLELVKRIDIPSKAEAYITLKDHKDNFNEKLPCRLINPNKSEIGKVSKILLQNINDKIRSLTHFNQWSNTQNVIDWLKQIPDKEKCYFINFDIEAFYPNISYELLNNALVWAQQFVDISHEDKNIIQTAKNTLLYSNGNPLTKKNADSPHDVTMGSFDGAETCELIGLYCLSQLQELNINVGLYRDDGLCVSQLTRRQNDMLKKRIRKIFQDNGLNVDIECNKTAVDFLDVTLDLQRNIFKPYAKLNEVIQYVNKQSNLPPMFIRIFLKE